MPRRWGKLGLASVNATRSGFARYRNECKKSLDRFGSGCDVEVKFRWKRNPSGKCGEEITLYRQLSFKRRQCRFAPGKGAFSTATSLHRLCRNCLCKMSSMMRCVASMRWLNEASLLVATTLLDVRITIASTTQR